MSRMWIAHVCACVAIALPAAAARGGEVPTSLAIVPGDAAAFVTVDVPGVLKSPLCDEVRFALGAIKPAELAAFAKKFPVDPATIERVVVVLPTAATVTDPFPNLHPTAVSALAIVGCSKPFDATTLGKGFYPAGRPKSYRGRVYHFDEDAYPQNYGRTNAQVVTGPGTLFDGAARVKKPAGAATILVLESGAGETVWWTKPADRIAAAGKPPELFMNYETSSCWAAFSDGTVKRLTKKDDEKQLPALVARPMGR